MACGKDFIMIIKIIGAILVVIGCGGFGLLIVRGHKRQVRSMEQFISALDYMLCQLQYQRTPLPELCQHIINLSKGSVRTTFQALYEELESQICPDVEKCMHIALNKVKDMPPLTKDGFISLGSSLGKFDLDGQQRVIEALRHSCCVKLEEYTKNQDERLRSYQTLGLCAGAALAIIFV